MNLNNFLLALLFGAIGGYFCSMLMYWMFINDHKKQFLSWVAYKAENKSVLKVAELEGEVKQLKLDVLELMLK